MCERAAQLVAGVLGDLPVGQRVRILPHRYACRSVLEACSSALTAALQPY
jgi:hypothetical protein